ncbi:MAG TPA: cytochrome c [Gaiellales bacterium]|nr:cytochrome c [Gaiellales bacterium]
MTRLLLLVGAILLAFAIAAPVSSVQGQAQDQPGSPTGLGAQLFAENCSACHGVNGEGKQSPGSVNGVGDEAGFGPSLHGVGAQAADFYLRTGYMPLQNPYDQPRRSQVLFSPRQLRALIAYVASLGPGPPVPRPRPTLGSVSDGMRLFTDHCAGCHQIAAQGGYVPDSVAPALGPDSAKQIAEAVRIGPNLMPRFSRSLISDRELDSIIAYVLYTQSPDDRGGWSIRRVGPVAEGLVAWFVAGVVLIGVTLTVGRRIT